MVAYLEEVDPLRRLESRPTGLDPDDPSTKVYCTIPLNAKDGHVCKHILYMYTRMLQVYKVRAVVIARWRGFFFVFFLFIIRAV